jgi:ABC-type glycerol-3-phosphate transport system substrate-binding protein
MGATWRGGQTQDGPHYGDGGGASAAVHDVTHGGPHDQARLARRVLRRPFLAGLGALAAAGTATVLGACAGLSGQTPAGGGREAQKPATIQVWAEPHYPWREGVGKEITDPLLAANPWLTLDASVPTGNPHEKFLAAAAGGTPPDVYSPGSYWTQQDFVDGATLDLERLIQASRSIKKADIWASLRLDVEFRGHMTALPYAPDTRIMYMHYENAQSAGLDPDKPPAKWSEIEAGVQRAFRGGSGQVERLGWHPFMGSGGNYLWMVPYWQLGGELLNKDQTKVTLANQQAIDALTWLKRIVDGQGGWQAIEGFRKNFADTQGNTIFMAGGTTFLHATLVERGTQFKVKAPTMRYTVSSYPLPDKGGTVANYGGCPCFAIAKASTQIDAAWKFVEFVTNSDNNITFALANDSVPLRESSTSAAAYVGSDKARALQSQEMKKRRFVIAAPGGLEMLPLQDLVTPVMTGKMSIQDALKDRERALQEVLDRYLAKANTVKV